MKIKTMRRTYDEVMALPRPKHTKPWKPTLLFRTIMRIASAPDLWATHFTYTRDKKSGYSKSSKSRGTRPPS